ncbi:MAG: hypothetical protein AAB424_03555 [Patescibacteria group bacterium]
MHKLIVTASFLALLASQPAIAQTNTATAPLISGVTVSNVTAVSALISWSTDVASTSYVDFGTTNLYGNTLGIGTSVTSHNVTLLGLTDSTLYHFRVRSMESVANYESKSTDTTLTTTLGTVNTNSASNANSAVNTNVAAKTNLNANTNKNTNTTKNTNAATNTNSNKNTNVNANKNINANRNTNVNTNANANVNAGTSIFNQNVNSSTNSVTGTLNNTNTDLTNVNATTSTTKSDGRTGIVLIAVGVLLLVGIIVFAWWKARQQPVVRP